MKEFIDKVFYTERLLLEVIQEKEADFIFELTNTKGWLDFIGDRNIKSVVDAKDYIQKIKDSPSAIYWKVEHKQNHQVLGLVTLIQRDYLENYDIGFAFLPRYSKKGYAYEATKTILDYLLKTSKQEEVLAITQKNNTNSIRLLKKLGLEFKTQINQNDDLLEVYSIS